MCLNTEKGLVTLFFLTYVIYHVISKLRGNEKNVQLNNFGIALAAQGLFTNLLQFISLMSFAVINEKAWKWRKDHNALYLWGYWTSDASFLLMHWFFNLRYVKSTFRLPILQKSAEFFSEMLNRIIEQREEQHAVFTP